MWARLGADGARAHCWWKCQLVPGRETIRYYLLNVNIPLCYQETCLGMFITALYVITKIKQRPSKKYNVRLETIQCSMAVWRNKLQRIHTIQHFRTVKMTGRRLRTGFLSGFSGLGCSCLSRPCSSAPGWGSWLFPGQRGLSVQALLPPP